MALRFFLALLLLLPALPAMARDDGLEGSWALFSGETIIFRFDLEQGQDGRWRGAWLRPDSFGSDGEVFVRLRGPVERIEAMAALEIDGGVELSFPDPRPGAVPDIFRFRLHDRENAELTYIGTDLAPYPLRRVGPLEPVGPWDFSQIYQRPRAGEFSRNEVNKNEDLPAESGSPRVGPDFLDGL